MSDPAPDNPPPTRRPRRRHRWWRRTKWTVRLAVGVPLLLLTVVLLLMRSPLVGRIVGAQVEQATGGRWRADHAAIMLNGQIIVTELGLRVPGIEGPGGQLLVADHAVIDVDWWQLPPLKWVSSRPAGPVVRAVRLAEPAFRLSQSTDDDTLNIGKLAAAPSTGAAAALPRIDVIDGKVEFTEHAPTSGRFEELAVIPIAGALIPAENGQPAFTVRLQEIGRAPSVSGERRGMVLDGRVDLATGEASLKLLNISLDAWPAESVPSRFRDLWRQLAVQGAVRQTVFTYAEKIGLKVSVVLDDVALTVPVPAERPGDEDGYLSLRKVDGEIGLTSGGLTADLTGVIEQQPGRSQVKLRTRGLNFDSGFRCEITGREMSVASEPELLSYVPGVVREYLNMFGGPTGVIDAKVVLERGDPVDGQAAPVTVPEGRMTLRNGSAAFHKFPYPFHDLSGEVTFDDQTIRIVRIEGVGHEGARLTAAALVSPLTHDAMADVRVEVENVRVDDHLLEAMPPGHRRLLEVLFAEPEHKRLLSAGLVRDPAAGTGETAPGGGDHGAVPEFEFGGRARVNVHVHRPRGDKSPWDTRIGVRFDKAGLVPKPFPFPIVARELAIEINDNVAELTAGRFSGLHGGTADVAARVLFGSGGVESVDPDVRISARGVPVDELLLHAVPGEEPTPGSEDDGRLNAKEILRKMDIRGHVDCAVTLRGTDQADPPDELIGPLPLADVDYEVKVGLGNLTAAPAAALAGGADSGLCIREIDGSVLVTAREVRIDGLHAVLGRLDAAAGGTETFAHSEPAGSITLRLEAETLPTSSADQGRLHAEVELNDLDLRDAIAPAVQVFSSEAAEVLTKVREKHSPAGMVDAVVTVDSDRGRPGTPMQIGVEIQRAVDLTMRALGGEVALDEPSGVIRVTTRDRTGGDAGGDAGGAGERFAFENVSGQLGFNGAQAGGFQANGGLLLDAATGAVLAGEDLACRLEDWKFEGGLTQAILTEFGGEAVSEGYQGFAPQGVFDAEVGVTGRDQAMVIEGWVRPESLQIVRESQPIDFLQVGGTVGFRSQGGSSGTLGGTIREARAVTEEWSAKGAGTWSYRAPSEGHAGGVRIEAEFDGLVRRIGPELRSVLPAKVRRSLDKLDLVTTEPMKLERWKIGAELPDTDGAEGDRVWFEGEVQFAGLSADVGLPLTEAAGRIRIAAGESDEPSESAPPLQLLFDGPHLRLSGIELTDYRAEIQRIGDREVALREARADCHGGRVLATGSAVWPEPSASEPESAPDQPATLRFNALIAGVNFAPLLDDLDSAKGRPSGDREGPTAPVSSLDATRGTVDARIAVEMIEGDPTSRIGRGAIRIAKGDVLRLPLILPLMQVSNLMLPTGDRLDYLQATFSLDGQRANFDDISVLSDSLAIVGGGSITMPGMDLDMRFNTKSNRRIPLWSDVFEAVRDEIASTTVTGTVDTPVVRSEPLTGTRRMLGGMVAPGESRELRGPSDVARRERARVRGE